MTLVTRSTNCVALLLPTSRDIAGSIEERERARLLPKELKDTSLSIQMEKLLKVF